MDTLTPFVQSADAGQDLHHFRGRLDGMHCAMCARNVTVLLQQAGAGAVSVDVAQQSLSVHWAGPRARIDLFRARLAEAGYTLRPALSAPVAPSHEKDFSWLLAGGGFVLLMGYDHLRPHLFDSLGSPVLWDSFFWVLSVLILAVGGRTFFRSFVFSWHARVMTMDVPIALSLFLSPLVGLVALFHPPAPLYLDAGPMLLFFLLLGRKADAAARARAKETGQDLLSALPQTAWIEGEDPQSPPQQKPVQSLSPGMIQRVAMGEKIAADGVLLSAHALLDQSLITGETDPHHASQGQTLYAGTVNLGPPLRIRIETPAQNSLLAQMDALLTHAKQSQGRFVRLADRMAYFYTWGVFSLALITFALWIGPLDGPWQTAFFHALSVLIITCPCAMGLAVPSVQVLACGRLFSCGVLVKAPDGLERLDRARHVVFDKTGTLTKGAPTLCPSQDPVGYTAEDAALAARLALGSAHPISRALCAAVPAQGPAPSDVSETPGAGLAAQIQGRAVRLGSAAWCAVPADIVQRTAPWEGPVLWLAAGGHYARFCFSDPLRDDAAHTLRRLEALGLSLHLLSGDRAAQVAHIAQTLHFSNVAAAQNPVEKTQAIEALQKTGPVAMVGDGLNDAAALALADVSLSPASALDITQNVAHFVFRGASLRPLADAFVIARFAQKLVRQNFALSFLYNLFAVPLAMAGFVSPPIAALAMSLSSIVVVFNAQRLRFLRLG